MDYYKKQNVKKNVKNHLGVIIGTGVFAIVGATVFLIGCYISGWDFLKWLQSPWAERFFIMLGFGVIGILVLIYVDKLVKNSRK